jgi:lipoprotein-anchoring transpeptidase ErfK/SrfK
MLNKYIAAGLSTAFALVFYSSSITANNNYGKQICNSPYYVCVRTNAGITAVPKYNNVRYKDFTAKKVSYRSKTADRIKRVKRHFDLPTKIASGNIIKVNLGGLTWGAYDNDGNLVKSGAVSGGKEYCPDIHRRCRTVTGTFTIYTKKGPECKSKRFPVGKGGAPMPYCMFFHGGYAMHGSNAVPDYNASHGCVRMHPEDAQWLNQNFVRVGSTRVNVTY